MNNKELAMISRYVYKEAFLQGVLDQAGSNVSGVLENLEKKKHYLLNQKIFTTAMMCIYLAMTVFIPVSVFNNIDQALFLGNSASWVFLIGGLLNGLFFFIQMVYLIAVGIFSGGALFKSGHYLWLTVLPLRKSETGKIGFFTFIRGISPFAIVIFTVYPLATAIIIQDLVITLISLLISVVNTSFSIGMYIIIGVKLSKFIQNQNSNESRATWMRIFVLFLYLVLSLFIAMGFQFIGPKISIWLTSTPTSIENIGTIIKWVGWIPYPLSSGFLITGLIVGFEHLPPEAIIMSLIGLSLWLGMTILVIRKAIRIFHQIVFPKQKISDSSKNTPIPQIQDIKVDVVSPTKAFYLKDRQMLTRNIQSMMLVIFPLVLPMLGFLVSSQVDQSEGLQTSIMFGMNIFYAVMGALMSSLGVMGLEDSGATISASLPIRIRDSALSKLKLILAVNLTGFTLPVILCILNPQFATIFLNFIILVPIIPIYVLTIITLKVALLGKMKTKYVFTDYNPKAKVGKVILVFTVAIFLSLGFLFLNIILIERKNIVFGLIYLFPGELLILSLLIGVFNSMFPRTQKK